MVGHLFKNYDTIYVGFLSRILVQMSYIYGLLSHIYGHFQRIYTFKTCVYLRGLQGPKYTRAKMRVYAIT